MSRIALNSENVSTMHQVFFSGTPFVKQRAGDIKVCGGHIPGVLQQ